MPCTTPHREKSSLQARIEESVGSATDTPDLDPVYNHAEQHNIIHRIDRRLIPTLGVLYCFSLMDRTNLGSASIAGMYTELKLAGLRYNIIALVFFVTYSLFQPLAIVLCRKIGSRPFLSAITLGV
jgi:hypothetical protein